MKQFNATREDTINRHWDEFLEFVKDFNRESLARSMFGQRAFPDESDFWVWYLEHKFEEEE